MELILAVELTDDKFRAFKPEQFFKSSHHWRSCNQKEVKACRKYLSDCSASDKSIKKLLPKNELLDYGHGKRDYQHIFYRIRGSNREALYFLVAEEKLSKERIVEIKSYCPCSWCQNDRFSLSRYLNLVLGYDFGCLKSEKPSLLYIRLANEKCLECQLSEIVIT
jgi:hypothetical protein